MRLTTALVPLLLLMTALAWAQPGGGNADITVYTGWSFLNADVRYNPCPECLYPYDPTVTTTIGSSILFGVKGGYYLNKSMEVEGSFSVAPGHDVSQSGIDLCAVGGPCPYIAVFPYPYTNTRAVSYQYEGNFVYNVDAGSVTPFVTFGLGGISTDAMNATQHDFALNFGGGAKFYFSNIGIRFEVNDHVIPSYFLNDRTEHDVQVQYGFMFRLH